MLKKPIGRVLQILSGGAPEMPLHEVMVYREQLKHKYELPPLIPRLGNAGSNSYLVTPRVLEKVGDELAERFAWIARGSGCSYCGTLQQQMNRNGADWCERNQEKLIAKIIANYQKLREEKEGLANQILDSAAKTKLGRSAQEFYVKRQLILAIEAARAKAAQLRVDQLSTSEYNRPEIVSPKPIKWDPVRHLIYHIYPVAGNGIWQWNVDELAKRQKLFNGKMIFGIVHDETTDDPEMVKLYIQEKFWGQVEFLVKPNVPFGTPHCCENQTFYDMVAALPKDGIAYYSHAKGVTLRRVEEGVAKQWVLFMHQNCIDRFENMIKLLRFNGAASTFLTDFGASPVTAGTFFWFRVAEARARNWQRLRSNYPAVEQWCTDVFPGSVGVISDLRGKGGVQHLAKENAWESVMLDDLEHVHNLVLGAHPPQWPEGWKSHPNVITTHRDLVQDVAAKAIEEVYPSERYASKGIVIPAGGNFKARVKEPVPYFWCAFAAAYCLRAHNCSLPIEFWFLTGELEEIPDAKIWAAQVGATCRVYDGPMRCRGGWQLKIKAILNSAFEEVLHLDADNLVAWNPELLFESSAYQETGVMFWADNPNLKGPSGWLGEGIFERLGLDRRQPLRDIEAGQMVINKRKAWAALQVTNHLSEHADYWGGYNGGAGGIWYGDKTDFHVGCLLVDQPYHLDERFEFNPNHGFYVHRYQDEVVFQHCCHKKKQIAEGTPLEGLAQSTALALYRAHRLRQAGPLPWVKRSRVKAALRIAVPELRFAGLDHFLAIQMWHDVVNRNEYRLPRSLEGKKVLDIGGNVGAFSYACLHRGAEAVVAFEPFPRIAQFAMKNVGLDSRWQIYQKAVFDGNDVDLGYRDRGAPQSLGIGASEVICRAPSVTPNEALALLPGVDIIKLDCEGSEWYFFENAEIPATVSLILGEYHDLRGAEATAKIQAALPDFNLKLIEADDKAHGHFWATRKDSAIPIHAFG